MSKTGLLWSGLKFGLSLGYFSDYFPQTSVATKVKLERHVNCLAIFLRSHKDKEVFYLAAVSKLWDKSCAIRFLITD